MGGWRGCWRTRSSERARRLVSSQAASFSRTLGELTSVQSGGYCERQRLKRGQKAGRPEGRRSWRETARTHKSVARHELPGPNESSSAQNILPSKQLSKEVDVWERRGERFSTSEL